MSSEFQPRVDAAIWTRRPDYRALSIIARGFSIQTLPPTQGSLQPPAWMDEHLEAWRAAFRGFGANPRKTPSSFEALWKRLQRDGALPQIDPVVDLYNAVSIRYALPAGGEDIDLYAGSPRLGVATGAETFDTARNGESVLETPEPGEVIWFDDHGVTCRRWNWRQCRRTGLTGASRNLWFVLDRLAPMPLEELWRAGSDLTDGLRQMSPGVEITTSILEP